MLSVQEAKRPVDSIANRWASVYITCAPDVQTARAFTEVKQKSRQKGERVQQRYRSKWVSNFDLRKDCTTTREVNKLFAGLHARGRTREEHRDVKCEPGLSHQLIRMGLHGCGLDQTFCTVRDTLRTHIEIQTYDVDFTNTFFVYFIISISVDLGVLAYVSVSTCCSTIRLCTQEDV